jgi:transcriptional regulator with PAS, ATPase and Fis domain
MPKQQPLGYLATIEKNAIVAALDAHQGNRVATAKFLGISVRGLHYKIDAYRWMGYDIPDALDSYEASRLRRR